MQSQHNVTVLNAHKLHNAAHLSHTAEVVMTALSQRERLRNFTDISRLKNALIRSGEKIVDEDYAKYWTALQDAGVGRIVFSKRGKQDRFFWHYSMKKVAQAALEGKNIAAERIEAANVSASAAKVNTKKVVKLSSAKKPIAAKAPLAQSSNERLIMIPLRPDFCLEFAVPSNLSKKEAEMIDTVLKRLSA